jgi:tRNA (cmo5U34)-methyltransferase
MNQTDMLWQEADSTQFIELGAVYTPRRAQLAEALLGMLPAEEHDAFTAVELGVGQGWLADLLLRRFPRSCLIGLDGSETMLRAAGEQLRAHGARVELRPFRLEETTWRAALAPSSMRFIYSSRVVHHLDGPGKLALYRELVTKLEPGGALVIADLLAPGSEWERRFTARAWDAEVRRQSLELTGDERAWQQFDADDWNLYDHPDPMDMPSSLAEHHTWLTEAGFIGFGAPWALAGHAVYGAYKPE